MVKWLNAMLAASIRSRWRELGHGSASFRNSLPGDSPDVAALHLRDERLDGAEGLP